MAKKLLPVYGPSSVSIHSSSEMSKDQQKTLESVDEKGSRLNALRNNMDWEWVREESDRKARSSQKKKRIQKRQCGRERNKNARTYTIKAGDTYQTIATQHNMSVEALLAANSYQNIPSSAAPYVSLKIPSFDEALERKDQYVVKSGESLASIAEDLGLTTSYLRECNTYLVEDGDLVLVGDVLLLKS